MRRLLLFSMAALLLLPAAASARGGVPLPPGAAKSDNLEYLGSFGGAGLVEGKFDRVHGRRILITTGRFGFRTYDVSDPGRPRLLDEFQPALILDASAAQNPKTGYWQDEDMDIDTRRKLIIGALDPRHDDDERGEPCTLQGTLGAKNRDPDCRSGFFVISYGNPRDMRQVGDFVELPAGHTASCINDCDYVWTGGPARRDDLAYLGPFDTTTGWGDGRPIWVTDLRNARKPKVFGNPIDLYRNDGRTDYSHDVQVDERGIAWVSGRGGIRGYATKGTHRDPTSNLLREATPWDPILVAGGGVGGVNEPETMFMHNSWRPNSRYVKADGVERGNILIGTEEEFNEDCATDGRLVVSDLTDSWGGEPALNSTREAPYRMKPLDTWHPAQDTAEPPPGASASCSAHYFELQKSTLAQAWYQQGLRLLDLSDAKNVNQIGYWRVSTGDAATDSNSWDVGWRGNHVYLFDMNRGIEILRLKGGAKASARMRKVSAPRMKNPARYKAVSSLESGDLVCPLFQ
jgi:hypothetical protein